MCIKYFSTVHVYNHQNYLCIWVTYVLLLQLLLKKWATELNERSPEEKRSFKGKLASAQHSQTVTYMKPLLRKLKKRVCVYHHLTMPCDHTNN